MYMMSPGPCGVMVASPSGGLVALGNGLCMLLNELMMSESGTCHSVAISSDDRTNGLLPVRRSAMSFSDPFELCISGRKPCA